jgi:glycosyltransferase involved in cell wall biosynthesis
MHVIYVTPEFVSEDSTFDGGLANYIAKVGKLLISEGHQVSVLVISQHPDEEMKLQGMHVIRVNVLSKIISGFEKISFGKFSPGLRWLYQSFKLNRRLKRYLKTLKGDIVVQYSSYTVPSFFAPKEVRQVIRVSGYQADIYLGNGGKRDFRYHMIKKLEDSMFRRSKRVFGPSYLLKNIIKKNTGRDINIIRSPFLAPNLATTELAKDHDLSGKRYFLFFGTVSPLKGALEIAQIIQKLFKKYPDLYFAFVGRCEGNIQEILISAAGEFSSKLIFLGKLRTNELYPVIRNAKRVVLPSRFDNLPNTCLEAMSLGRIVIGTRGASFDEMIQDGVSGLLCEIQNPESLWQAIERSMALTSEQELQMEQSAHGVIANFSADRIVNELVQFYKES